MDTSKNNADTAANDRTLSRVAHDLRNPLNSISMNAELVKMKLQRGGDPVDLIAYMDRILQECKNCGDVLESSMKDRKENQGASE